MDIDQAQNDPALKVGTGKAKVLTPVPPLDLLCIRDDTMLCMGNMKILESNPRLRIYHGKLSDPWDVRKQYLDGQKAEQWAAPIVNDGRPDVTRMSREELVAYALEEYGVELAADIEYGHALLAVIEARNEVEAAEANAPVGKMAPKPKTANKVPLKARATGLAA